MPEVTGLHQPRGKRGRGLEGLVILSPRGSLRTGRKEPTGVCLASPYPHPQPHPACAPISTRVPPTLLRETAVQKPGARALTSLGRSESSSCLFPALGRPGIVGRQPEKCPGRKLQGGTGKAGDRSWEVIWGDWDTSSLPCHWPRHTGCFCPRCH